MAEQESGNALRNDIEPRDITLKDCRDEADGKTAEKLADEHAIPYPEGSRLAFIIISIAAAVFLTALDETIIATAIPRITDEFNSIPDVGWYGSAYFLTLSAFQFLYGKLFGLFSNKTVFIVALALFEIGSVICAAAPNSAAFIIGRAVAGLGSAGINAGYIIILAGSVPLERRAVFISSYSIMYGLATVIAPVIGGAFTSRVTWRWCFWINLPLGALTLLVIIFLYHPRELHNKSTLSLHEKWRQLDLLSTGITVVGISCLLLVLQWGGARYPWRSWRIVLLLVLFALLTISFVVLQILRKEKATIPPRIIRQRSVASSAFFVFSTGAAVNIMEYYLPIYFQAIKGVDALQSGVRVLPMIITVIIFSLVAGCGVNKWGYYTPFMLFGSVLVAVATGLITTWSPTTPTGPWIGYQILLGTGTGLAIQQAHTAAQTVLADADVPTGVVVLIFAQILGGTIFLSVAENVFSNRLVAEISKAVPGLDAGHLLHAGATSLRQVVTGEELKRVVEAYSRGLSQTFLVAVGLAALGFFGAAGTEWRSVKKKGQERRDG